MNKHVFYLSLWSAILVHISWTQAAIDQGNREMTNLTNLTQLLSDHMISINLRLNDENLSTASSSIDQGMNIDLTSTLRLKDMLNVFDLNIVASQWTNIRDELSTNCSKDFYKYLLGLTNSTMWSVKSKFISI